jgi:hypothetical protein
MSGHLLLFTTVIALGACRPTQSPASSQTSLECPAVRGADAVLEAGAIVLLGEYHGTKEVPAFVGALACDAARRGYPVVVGLEFSVDEQPAFARFLASDGGPAARQELLRGAAWRQPMQDGRRSEAMLSLLDTIRQLRAAHLPVEVFAFDVSFNEAETEDETGDADADSEAELFRAYSEGMANNVLARIEGSPNAIFLVLAGRMHTRTARGVPWDPDHLPAGYYLRARKPGVISLEGEHAGGTAWVCTDERCGVHELDDEDRGPTTFIALHPAPDADSGVDGIFYVGRVTASPPAIAPGR